jgi:hypothetical protein
MNKTGVRRKTFITSASAEHLLSRFSSHFFGVKLLYDYGFWRCAQSVALSRIREEGWLMVNVLLGGGGEGGVTIFFIDSLLGFTLNFNYYCSVN